MIVYGEEGLDEDDIKRELLCSNWLSISEEPLTWKESAYRITIKVEKL